MDGTEARVSECLPIAKLLMSYEVLIRSTLFTEPHDQTVILLATSQPWSHILTIFPVPAQLSELLNMPRTSFSSVQASKPGTRFYSSPAGKPKTSRLPLRKTQPRKEEQQPRDARVPESRRSASDSHEEARMCRLKHDPLPGLRVFAISLRSYEP